MSGVCLGYIVIQFVIDILLCLLEMVVSIINHLGFCRIPVKTKTEMSHCYLSTALMKNIIIFTTGVPSLNKANL